MPQSHFEQAQYLIRVLMLRASLSLTSGHEAQRPRSSKRAQPASLRRRCCISSRLASLIIMDLSSFRQAHEAPPEGTCPP